MKKLTSVLFVVLALVCFSACEKDNKDEIDDILNRTTVRVPSSTRIGCDFYNFSSKNVDNITKKLKELGYIGSYRSSILGFPELYTVSFSEENVHYRDTADVRKKLDEKLDNHYKSAIKKVIEFDFNTVCEPNTSPCVLTLSLNLSGMDYSVRIVAGKSLDFVFKKDWATDNTESPIKSIRWTDITSDNKKATLTMKDGSTIESKSVAIKINQLVIVDKNNVEYCFKDIEEISMMLNYNFKIYTFK